ncbi:MAG: diguanylate cyclase domain-containing protein [Smithellaceae bacterium]
MVKNSKDKDKRISSPSKAGQRTKTRRQAQFTNSYFNSILNSSDKALILTTPEGIITDRDESTGLRDVGRKISPAKKVHDDLERYRNFVENIEEGCFESDMFGTITFANEAAAHKVGYSLRQFIGLNNSHYTTPEEDERIRKICKGILKTGTPSIVENLKVRTQQGETRYLDLYFSLMHDKQGHPIGFRGISRDVTERKKIQDALQESEERIRVLFKNIPVPTFVWKEQNKKIILSEFNAAALQFTRGAIAAFIGKGADEFYADMPRINEEIRQCFLSQKSAENSFWYRPQNETEEKYLIVKYAYASPDQVIMHLNDITTQKKAEENLRHISIHDTLTGLYNRFYSDAEIYRISVSRIRPVSFFIIDLNGLKSINDRLGHAAGDLYIKNSAALLKKTFRPEDMIARIGGDEFIVILPSIDEGTCAQMMSRLKNNLAAFNRDADQPISMATGFATAYSGDNIEALIAEADRRMYKDKAGMRAVVGITVSPGPET